MAGLGRLFVPLDGESVVSLNLLDGPGPVVAAIGKPFPLRVHPFPPVVYRVAILSAFLNAWATVSTAEYHAQILAELKTGATLAASQVKTVFYGS